MQIINPSFEPKERVHFHWWKWASSFVTPLLNNIDLKGHHIIQALDLPLEASIQWLRLHSFILQMFLFFFTLNSLLLSLCSTSVLSLPFPLSALAAMCTGLVHNLQRGVEPLSLGGVEPTYLFLFDMAEWDRLGSGTLCCRAHTWTSVSLGNKIQGNYKELKISACTYNWGRLSQVGQQ